MTASPPRQSPSRLKRGFQTLVSIVAVFVTLEVASRCFVTLTPILTEADDLVGVRYIRHLDQMVYDEESKQKILFRTNSIGFRGPEYASPKPSDTLRVALLGDSFVAAHAVEESESLAGVLTSQLVSRSRYASIEVMNFGVTGSCTGQELRLYECEIRQLKPEFVCLVFTSDDVLDNSSETSNKPIIRYRLNEADQLELEPFSTVRAQSSRWLNRNLRLYDWQKEKVNHLSKNLRQLLKPNLASGAEKVEKLEWVYMEPVPEPVAKAWRLTEAVLAEFQEKVEGDGARLIIAYLPTASELNSKHAIELQAKVGNACRVDCELPEKRLKEICEQQSIQFYSLREAFPAKQLSVAELNSMYLNGIGHLTPEGHAKMAEVLAKNAFSANTLTAALRSKLK